MNSFFIEPLQTPTDTAIISTEPKVDKEKQWRDAVVARRIESVVSVVAAQLTEIKSLFEKVCGKGRRCTINVGKPAYRTLTFDALEQTGFTLKESFDQIYTISLPRVATMVGDENRVREWRHWVKKTKHKYEKARKKRIRCEYKHLKSEFARAADEGRCLLVDKNNIMSSETLVMALERLQCEIEALDSGGYRISLPA